jgi:DNA polymerase III alpha subunit
MSIRQRTGYSFRTAVGSIPEIIALLKTHGRSIAPIADRASAFGWVNWDKEARRAGMKPVFGVELAVASWPEVPKKKPAYDHWTFLARDTLRPVNELVALATQQFHYQPRLDLSQALAATGVVAIMGHRTNLETITDAHGAYVAVSPAANPAYVREAIAIGFRPIAANAGVYPTPEDAGWYETQLGRDADVHTYPQHVLDDETWRAWMLDHGHDGDTLAAALANREAVLEGCNATLRQGALLAPPRPATLRVLCEQGAAARGLDLANPTYAERLTRELEVIEGKGFADYFYIVADLVKWARTRMCVGPARGSSCGSLVCFLLGITTVDPLKYDLLFERFLDASRSDLPDIDIDFSDTKRDQVFTYLEQTYGKERVARLGTVSKYGDKAALNEAAAALLVPPPHTHAVLGAVTKYAAQDARAAEGLAEAMRNTEEGQAFLAEHPEMQVATRMVAQPRHASQHAAGVLITAEPVTEYVPLDMRTGAVMADKRDAEVLDLLKIDALGLKQLSVFEDTLAQCGLPHDHLESVPLDDPKAFAVLNGRKFGGIFQFTGAACRGLASRVTFTELEDLISITALARPGPMSSGGASEWVRRKRGDEPVRFIHPAFKPMLEKTLGVLIYQETLMQIAREIGDLDWPTVTSLRKAMAKSMGDAALNKYAEPWKAGALAKGIPTEVVEVMWGNMCGFGAYGFNRSHAAAYALISYWCCYLKGHYPLQFAAATLQHMGEVEEQKAFLRELHDEGIHFVPVDVEHSTDKWRVQQNRLIGPLTNIQGLGPRAMGQILTARSRGENLPAAVQKKLQKPTTPLDLLFPIRAAVEKALPNGLDPQLVKSGATQMQVRALNELGKWDDESEFLFLGRIDNMQARDMNEEKKLARRGGKKWDGRTACYHMRLVDDSGEIFGFVGVWNFDDAKTHYARAPIQSLALWAVKGRLVEKDDFRMMIVRGIRFLGTDTTQQIPALAAE